MIHSIKEWFKAAKPEPTVNDALVQIGCHYEEVAEMAVALWDGEVQESAENAASEYKNAASEYRNTDDYFSYFLGDLTESQRIQLLDALCDQIVTAVGVAYMMGMDIEGALAEVNRSNWSKFEGGVPVFNEHGKIVKGAEYTPPELSDYI